MSGRWIDRVCAIDAERLAVSDGQERLTYGELLNDARRLARRFRDDYGNGRCVLVRAESSAAFVRTLLGVMLSGNTPVPIEPSLPDGSLDAIRGRSNAVAVLAPCPRPDTADAGYDGYDSGIPALVLFTSGTTGVPKGVMVSDANLNHSCRVIADYLGYSSYPSAAVALPLYYSYALISQVLCHLYVGGHVRLFRDLKNPIKFAAAVTDEELATFCGVPSTFHALAGIDAMSPLRMPSIRVVCSAGAAMELSLLSRIRTMFPNATVFNNYGMTEAAPRITFIRDDDSRFLEGSCGRPMEGVEIRIADPDTGASLPDGELGMLVVRGPNVTAGYLNDPEQTAAAFTGDGYLKSSDMAYIREGYAYIVGRYDDIFNCGGEKISPAEIEQALCEHSHVRAAAVVGLPDPQRGKIPVAFLQTECELRRADLIAHLGRLISRSRIPQRFFRVSEFPLTSNGKLQRRHLSVDAAYVLGELS